METSSVRQRHPALQSASVKHTSEQAPGVPALVSQ
jgi:hypothetical protein